MIALWFYRLWLVGSALTIIAAALAYALELVTPSTLVYAVLVWGFNFSVAAARLNAPRADTKKSPPRNVGGDHH